MFQLTEEEWDSLKSQIATSNAGRGGRRTPPYAFTEQGVAMLSSVLNSERAVAVNVEIMRAFVRFRHFLANNEQLTAKLNELEMRFEGKLDLHDRHLRMLVEAMRRLRAEHHQPPPPPRPPPKRRMGFHNEDEPASKAPKGKRPAG